MLYARYVRKEVAGEVGDSIHSDPKVALSF
jgi:hypothetical protein